MAGLAFAGAALVVVLSALARPPTDIVQPDDQTLASSEKNAGELLSKVQCIRYLTLNGSDQTALFEAQTKKMGLWDRVTVQTDERDPEGKAAGCLRAHVKAWNLALDEGCDNLLVLEEDVFFDRTMVQPTFSHINYFLGHNTSSYDMLFLGWGDSFLNLTNDGVSAGYTSVTPIKGYKCIWTIHHWLDTTAYVISRSMMERNKNLTYINGLPIDVELQALEDRNRYFTVRPTVAFQRYHPPPPGANESSSADGGTGDAAELYLSIPALVHDFTENTFIFGRYDKEGYSMKECMDLDVH